MANLLERHGLCALRFEAVDGSREFPETAEEAVAATDSETGKRRKGFLTPGERGYRESMRRILQAQVQWAGLFSLGGEEGRQDMWPMPPMKFCSNSNICKREKERERES